MLAEKLDLLNAHYEQLEDIVIKLENLKKAFIELDDAFESYDGDVNDFVGQAYPFEDDFSKVVYDVVCFVEDTQDAICK